MPSNTKTADFEQSFNELESLVQHLEKGDLSLEASLEAFEKGIKLTRDCQSLLDQAEQKIQILKEGKDGITVEPFNAEEV